MGRKKIISPEFKNVDLVEKKAFLYIPKNLKELIKERTKELRLNFSNYVLLLIMNDLGIYLDESSSTWKYDEKEVERKITEAETRKYKKALLNILKILDTTPEELRDIFKEENLKNEQRRNF